jgi:hypothetical protein
MTNTNTTDTQTEPSVFDLMENIMEQIERYESDEAHITAPCGDEPTPAQLARERVMHDFETAFNYLTKGM